MMKLLVVLSLVNVIATLLIFRRARELDHLAVSVAGLGNALNETLEALQSLFDAAQGVIAERITAIDRAQLTLDIAPRGTSAASVSTTRPRRQESPVTPPSEAIPAVISRDSTGEP
jgi:hypothetical protein